MKRISRKFRISSQNRLKRTKCKNGAKWYQKKFREKFFSFLMKPQYHLVFPVNSLNLLQLAHAASIESGTANEPQFTVRFLRQAINSCDSNHLDLVLVSGNKRKSRHILIFYGSAVKVKQRRKRSKFRTFSEKNKNKTLNYSFFLVQMINHRVSSQLALNF